MRHFAQIGNKFLIWKKLLHANPFIVLSMLFACTLMLTSCKLIFEQTGAEIEDEKVLKVMSYNIHMGIGAANRYELEKIAEVIRDSGADIVGVQEIERFYDERTNFEDQAERLAEMLGMHYAFQKTTWKSPVPESQGNERQFGHAVFSKYPIEAQRGRIYTAHGTHYRGLLETEIQVNGETLYFYVTHWGLSEDERLSQAKQTLEWMGQREGHQIIVGDFNAEPESPEIALMLTKFHDAFDSADQAYTFKSTSPVKRIDYIFGSPTVKFDHAQVLTSYASDHLPIVAEVTFEQAIEQAK